VRRRPDHRWLNVKSSPAEPVHPVESACWRHLHKLEMVPVIDRALEIYEETFERERLQPWLLAGAEDRDIQDRTGLPIEITRAYRHLFFDVSVFRDMFDKQLWVHRYQGTPEGLAYLQKAVIYGVEAIAHVMGAPVKLDPHNVVEQSMRETFFRGQALRYAKLGSPEAAAASSLLKAAVDSSQLMTKTRPANITDIMFKLKNREMTVSVEDVELEGEILH
jgi:hypothetical protein